MQLRSVAAIFLMWTASGSAAVDPGLLNLVMPDAKIVSGIQVQQCLAAPFGQFLMTQMPPNTGMLQFATATGFDFTRDLNQIVIATTSSSTMEKTPSLILARGTFQPDKVLALAALTGATTFSYMGIQMVTPPPSVTPNSLAFLDSSTLAIGTPSLLKDVIDRRAAGSVFAGALAQKAIEASTSNDVWFATTTPISQFLNGSNSPVPSAIMGAVLESSGGMHFAPDSIVISGQALTASDQDARSLADVLKFLGTMIQSNRSAQVTQAAALFQNAQFSANGATVQMVLTVAEQQMEQMFPVSAAARRKKAAVR